ncbi:NAD-dependent epimerase/dehydratase family protein [Schlesneria sp.]|uniref:NAD-dependent epimerase/dehydratase family protein n=1 Tax=Schlesneria sp. TaxID=2762018 RepID=UPI002EF89B11
MKRVLVTAGSGFVGRHCLPALSQRGYEIHVISTRPASVSLGDLHQVDLMDPVSVKGLIREVQPTHLLHLAWITEPRRYLTAHENFDWLIASQSLLRAFHDHGGQRVVMSGSCAEYDWKDGVCREETTPLTPASFYGQCKHLLQMSLASYARQTGLSWGWGRLFFLYGPYGHTSRIPGVVIDALLRNQPARCSHGLQQRDFLHIADAADALVTLLESDVQGPINIGSGEPVAIREIVLQLADRMGRRDLIQLGAIESAPGDPPLVVADVNRLCNTLGWKPAHSLATGLDATLEWYRGESHDIAC